jgi:hypothetical protein
MSDIDGQSVLNPPAPSFTQAIYQLLAQFSESLKLQGATEHSVSAYIFGGCAVHLYNPQRVSSDLDLDVNTLVISVQQVAQAKRDAGKVFIAVGPDNAYDILEIDRTYTSSIGPLHEDFPDRATILEANPGSPLVVLLPSAEDLALSKLDRLSEADIDDILVLMGSSKDSWALLEGLTCDVEKYYPCVQGSLTGKLNYVINYRRGPLSEPTL